MSDAPLNYPDDLSCKSQDSANGITPDHAVVLAAVPNATYLDYVKSVSYIVGSSYIHSVYIDGPRVKIYMKEKKHVQKVINNGIVVRGCQMNVDFLMPPSTKVVLTNVDPIVPDKSLMCLLNCYGMFKSSLIHQKISDEEGYSHIESSSRVVYMDITEGKTIPKKLPLVHGNSLYEIHVHIESPRKMLRYSASQTD